MLRNDHKATSSDRSSPVFPKRCERLLLAVFLLSRLWLYSAHRGEAVGWDVGAHLAMLDHWPWDPHLWNIQTLFYDYHPPIAFLLPRILVVMGIGSALSVQTIGSIASVIGFFFLRASLKRLKLLHSWAGLVFLYVTSSLPMQIYLARSINMDVIVYMEACAVLYFSIRIFFGKSAERPARHVRTWPALFLCLSLLAALFTKYSGVLLLALPVLTAAFSAWDTAAFFSRTTLHRVGIGCLLCVVSAGIAFPYYFGRYYVQTGQFFPTNMDLLNYDQKAATAERAKRDADPAAFWKAFLSPSPDAVRIQDRDQQTVRLSNTWKDIWSANKYNIQQTPLSLFLSAAYAHAAQCFLLAGSVSFALLLKKKSVWIRFGCILILFSLLELLSLILYSYHYPHPIGVPNKGIYVAPALLCVGYLLTLVTFFAGDIRFPRTVISHLAVYSSLLCVALFMLLNAVLPVY